MPLQCPVRRIRPSWSLSPSNSNLQLLLNPGLLFYVSRTFFYFNSNRRLNPLMPHPCSSSKGQAVSCSKTFMRVKGPSGRSCLSAAQKNRLKTTRSTLIPESLLSHQQSLTCHRMPYTPASSLPSLNFSASGNI